MDLLDFSAHLCTLLVAQNLLADSQRFWCDLQQFIVCQEFQAVFQAQIAGWYQTQCIVTAAGTGIGQVLPLADIYYQVFCLGRSADNHAFINRNACADKQRAALLGVKQTVGDCFAGFKGNQGTSAAAGISPLYGAYS